MVKLFYHMAVRKVVSGYIDPVHNTTDGLIKSTWTGGSIKCTWTGSSIKPTWTGGLIKSIRTPKHQMIYGDALCDTAMGLEWCMALSMMMMMMIGVPK